MKRQGSAGGGEQGSGRRGGFFGVPKVQREKGDARPLMLVLSSAACPTGRPNMSRGTSEPAGGRSAVGRALGGVNGTVPGAAAAMREAALGGGAAGGRVSGEPI